jgi:putative ABC transport system substrate-binding protein
MREVETAARTLGLEIDTAELRRAEDVWPAFDAFKSRVQALYVCIDALVNANGVRINVEGGGLMSYGANNVELFRRAGDYVDKILRGAKPGDIPVEQPTKFDLVINLTTAKAIGLTIPESFLQRANELIE